MSASEGRDSELMHMWSRHGAPYDRSRLIPESENQSENDNA